MTAQTRPTLKTYFNTGDKPTEAQFVDLIDSFARVGTVADPTSEIVLYPGASSTAPFVYGGAMPYWKATSSGAQESVVSMGWYGKGRNTSIAAGMYFGVSGNFGRETMMYLESTGVNATCNRQLSFEPGFSGTGQFPSIRAEGIGTFATDPDIPLGFLSRGTGYIGFHTHGNGGYHGEAQGDVLQCLITDTSGASKQVQITGGSNQESPRVLANCGTSANADLWLGSQAAGSIKFITDAKTYSRAISGTNTEQLRITHVASADNLYNFNASDGGVPTLRAFSSSNADVATGFSTQGAANHNFYTATATLQARFTHTANANSWIDITGATSANPVEIVANAGYADKDLKLTPKGSAFVQYGAFTGDAAINTTGYIKIRTADGVIRRVAIVSGT